LINLLAANVVGDAMVGCQTYDQEVVGLTHGWVTIK